MKQIEKYKGLLDMINGGGANAEGDKFQGGGLLSILANALATPYGSEDRAEEAASLLGNTRPQMRPNRPASIAPAASLRPQARPQIKTNFDPFGGEGPNITGVAAERGMGLDPFGGAGDFIPPQSQVDQEMAMGLGPFGYGGRPIYENVPETSGMNPSNAYPDPRQRFAKELVEMIGPDEAENYFGTGAGEMLYNNYVKNGYKFLNY
tara:strand:- start:58 stop:678 length:621 start_codon:yes stop_codon:yes gene_type:complete